MPTSGIAEQNQPDRELVRLEPAGSLRRIGRPFEAIQYPTRHQDLRELQEPVKANAMLCRDRTNRQSNAVH